MPISSPPAGIVLAAGSGTRFGGPKAPYPFQGERLVDRAISVLQTAGITPIVVVLGAWVDEIPDCTVVINEDHASGMGSSLRTGLSYLIEHQVNAPSALITLVDLPHLQLSSITEVMDSPAELVQACYHGTPGHPVKIGAHHWDALIADLSGDTGAKKYLQAHHAVMLEIDDPGIIADLDEQPA